MSGLTYTSVREQEVNDSQELSTGSVRYLAWIALLLVIVMTAILSTYIGNTARKELLSKQEEFAVLLAENLNNHIYRRFALPTILGFGKIELKLEFQFNRLDEIIKSTIHGLDIKRLRIYGNDNTVSYSTDKEEAGTVIESAQVEEVEKGSSASFLIESTTPYWKSFFQFPLAADSYTLKTTYPLRLDAESKTDAERHLMGVIEFTRDITGDIERAIRFQQFVILVTLLTSTLLMSVLLFLIQRYERALAGRMLEKQRLLSELHQNEKLAGMGRVIASIAHEIRNPLGIIRSSAELLLKRGNETDTVTIRILQAIYDESKRLSQTVSDFLDYARPRQLKRSEIEINAILHHAITFLEAELHSKKITVVRAGLEECKIQGDSDLLYRVFYNIIANAGQAMGEEGTITITIMAPIVFPDQKETFAGIVFFDSGTGFSEESFTQALDPFFTTKDDGTGLGLAIVSSIVGSHGGFITLENPPSGGGQVTVYLPI